MKYFITVLILLSAPALPATTKQQSIIDSVETLKKINGELLRINNESAIDLLLEEKVDILNSLIAQLRQSKKNALPFVNQDKATAFLLSRIKINTEKGHQLAVLRDQLKLKSKQIDQAIRDYLEYLIESSKNYRLTDDIVHTSQALLAKSKQDEKNLLLPKTPISNRLYTELVENHQLFSIVNNSYQDILKYVSVHPDQIASVHWFQKISLLSIIDYLNHFELIQPINYKLAPFKLDIGSMSLSMIIILFVYLSYPFVFNCTRWCIENHVIDKEVEQQELIYHEIRRPARSLLVFWGINQGADTFFYKTDFRHSLEGAAFVIYSLIFIWLLFKIIDSIVLVQIEKITSSNKALRKELFNLGVKSVKGLVILIVLAFGLSHFGISLTAIISTLGVGGLAFALAAKDTLSNLFGGMTILFDNVFRMGDWVKIGDVEGTVAEIGLRSTTIRTFDNALITIPNASVSVSSVKNWNRRAVGRRIKMYIGVTYESDMSDIRQAIADIRDMLKNHPEIANPKQIHSKKKRAFKLSSLEDTHGIKSTQLVFLDRYSDFSIDILIYCFTRTVNWSDWLTVKEDVLFKIADILANNHLEFAYPTQVMINRIERPHYSLNALS